jgi:hypothetical protein
LLCSKELNETLKTDFNIFVWQEEEEQSPCNGFLPTTRRTSQKTEEYALGRTNKFFQTTCYLDFDSDCDCFLFLKENIQWHVIKRCCDCSEKRALILKNNSGDSFSSNAFIDGILILQKP